MVFMRMSTSTHSKAQNVEGSRAAVSTASEMEVTGSETTAAAESARLGRARVGRNLLEGGSAHVLQE